MNVATSSSKWTDILNIRYNKANLVAIISFTNVIEIVGLVFPLLSWLGHVFLWPTDHCLPDNGPRSQNIHNRTMKLAGKTLYFARVAKCISRSVHICSVCVVRANVYTVRGGINENTSIALQTMDDFSSILPLVIYTLDLVISMIKANCLVCGQNSVTVLQKIKIFSFQVSNYKWHFF